MTAIGLIYINLSSVSVRKITERKKLVMVKGSTLAVVPKEGECPVLVQ
jgi:hypothetical protein